MTPNVTLQTARRTRRALLSRADRDRLRHLRRRRRRRPEGHRGRRAGRGRRSDRVGLGAHPQESGRGLREEVPQGQDQAGQRGYRRQAVHRPAERDQRRFRCPGRGPDRVLRPRPVLDSEVGGRPRALQHDPAGQHFHPGPVECGQRRQGRPCPADGLRPDGAVLQQEGLRQARRRGAHHVGRVRRGGPYAAHRRTRKSSSPTTPATPAPPPASSGRRAAAPIRAREPGRRRLQRRRHQEVHANVAEAARREADRPGQLVEQRVVPAWPTVPSPPRAIGAWMPANFASGVASASGDWRVAPLPQWTKGETTTAENGGSSLAMPEDARNKELAYAFIEYATTGAGAASRVAQGAFPATRADLESKAFLEKPFPYFGGQKANTVFAEAADNVGTGWEYLLPGVRQLGLQRHRRQGVRLVQATGGRPEGMAGGQHHVRQGPGLHRLRVTGRMRSGPSHLDRVRRRPRWLALGPRPVRPGFAPAGRPPP